ncbi:hypothetical protein CLV72_10344 [Allonocardiopsis opalescens]|uniref:TetR family transcriptional regulator n=1 Tax=Allonocardiopsis opalescens TaxID=1144618 RepID=A0A2T0Q6K6_9ACTN|nr:hypothetical protein CLV72_10344 [Allonocardiopsis opalescens]
MNGIARRAGTGKHLAYRRWKNRPELFPAAPRHFAAAVGVPDTGEPREDLVALLERIRQVFDLLPRGLIAPGPPPGARACRPGRPAAVRRPPPRGARPAPCAP